MTTVQMVTEIKKVIGEKFNDNTIIDCIIDFDEEGTTDEQIVKCVIDELLNS